MAPFQKRALYSLLAGTALAIGLAVLIVMKGVNSFDDDPGFRLVVYALWVGVPLVYLISLYTLRRPEQVDERDRLIWERSSKTQYRAVLFLLVVWAIALTEVYRDSGQVPVIFMTLIMISALVVSTIAQSLGIVVGYWRMGRNG